MYKYRVLISDDAKDVLILQKSSFKGDFVYPLNVILSSIVNHICYGCFNTEGELVGFILTSYDTITCIAVDKSHQKRGIGKFLISYIISCSDECLYLMVDKTNLAACKLYTNLKFRKFYDVKNYYGLGLDGTKMVV
jgi:ribosomal protein S18 acetylase RimI-like enzyme